MQLTQAKPLSSNPSSKWAAVVASIACVPRSVPKREQGLDRPDPLAAAAALAVDHLRAGNAGAEEIDRPAVEVDAVDEVLLAPGGFAEMLARRVVGIADRAVAVAVVDRVLAPDVALADVDALLLGEVAQVLGGEKSGDHALRPVAAADHLRNHLQAVVQVAVHLLAGVVHVGEDSRRG